MVGDVEGTHILLDEPDDEPARLKLLRHTNARQQNALHLASGAGFDNIVEVLVAADRGLLEIADRNGWTALHYACTEKRISIAAFLLRKGHPVNRINDEGSTALHYAVRIGPRHQTEDLLDLFYTYGAELDAQTSHGEAPLHQAAFRGNYSNSAWLLAHGAKPNIVDKNGHTPLHKAAMTGHKFVVATLLDHGCDYNIKGNKGETALALAVEFNMVCCERSRCCCCCNRASRARHIHTHTHTHTLSLSLSLSLSISLARSLSG
jgi:ankyrin repeat protein